MQVPARWQWHFLHSNEKYHVFYRMGIFLSPDEVEYRTQKFVDFYKFFEQCVNVRKND